MVGFPGYFVGFGCRLGVNFAFLRAVFTIWQVGFSGPVYRPRR